MIEYKYLSDASFLKEVDELRLKYYYTRIIVLTFDERVITEIQGRVLKGSSININGSSALRRTCSMNIVIDESDFTLAEIQKLLGINQKIKIEVGYKNTTGKYPEYDILWFPQGVFVINQISFSHNMTSTQASISCKDKMCLLNGEAGGKLPTAVTFSPYTQYDEWGGKSEVEPTFYEIIQTAVCNFGGEALDNIIISDVPLKIKQICHYGGNSTVYYSEDGRKYTTDESIVKEEGGKWDRFGFNEDIGYRYIDFVYPKELTCGMGSSVCTVLDEICKYLGNFEYYYDVYGTFIFREKKNYLNNSFIPDNKNRLVGISKDATGLNNLTILDNGNYQVDFSEYTSSIYTFNQGGVLINSYSNNQNYETIKNDYHIWGKSRDGLPIHYHLSLQKKPQCTEHRVYIERDDNGNPTGNIRCIAPKNREDLELEFNKELKNLRLPHADYEDKTMDLDSQKYYTGEFKDQTIEIDGEITYLYTPKDWRVELFLRGLEKIHLHQRPDIYEQELIDNLPTIYKFKVDEDKKIIDGDYKEDIFRPNNLSYWIDYIEPFDAETEKFCVGALNPRIFTQQQDNIKRIYDRDVPNNILLEEGSESHDEEQQYAEDRGDVWTNLNPSLFSYVVTNTVGYSAIEVAREAVYQYITFNNAISLQSRPIYYLEANRRITVNDTASGIYGDYIVNSISVPLDAEGTMSISAVKVLDRV